MQVICDKGNCQQFGLLGVTLHRVRSLLHAALFGFVGIMFAQSVSKTPPAPIFSELSPADRERLDQQRAVVLNVAKHKYGVTTLTRTKSDLPVLQRLLDDKVFNKSQTYELQCLGVAFGDVLTTELPLRWVMVSDEYGTDPTLRFKNLQVNVNALTMISKRVERNEPVQLTRLLRITREQLPTFEKKGR